MRSQLVPSVLPSLRQLPLAVDLPHRLIPLHHSSDFWVTYAEIIPPSSHNNVTIIKLKENPYFRENKTRHAMFENVLEISFCLLVVVL